MWGGLPFIVPSGTAMKYLYHAKVINEEDVPVGAHYRAREDMLNNVRGYRIVKKGLSRRLSDIEHERRRAKSEVLGNRIWQIKIASLMDQDYCDYGSRYRKHYFNI